MEILQKSGEILLAVKEKRPLVHHITNYVTMNDCANAVLAVGGSPIMANDPSEVEEVAAVSSALVLNMGTLNPGNAQSMLSAGKVANERHIPVVFDPVGAGMTSFRRNIAEMLLSNVKPSVVRGNLSEIMCLSGLGCSSRGIDSDSETGNGKEIARALAKSLNCIVAVTGRKDIVTDGRKVYQISNGSSALSKVTGTGCMVSSLIGTFCGADSDYLAAAAGGALTMAIAGQLAYEGLATEEGIGTFKVKLFDHLSNLGAETFVKKGDIRIE